MVENVHKKSNRNKCPGCFLFYQLLSLIPQMPPYHYVTGQVCTSAFAVQQFHKSSTPTTSTNHQLNNSATPTTPTNLQFSNFNNLAKQQFNNCRSPLPFWLHPAILLLSPVSDTCHWQMTSGLLLLFL